ncbi:hypothetical protein BDW59DRAFT_153730 [Aspergillus cavernicola]|uniref:gamma-glutamylcyclotransferase n=1 Tax=Aspergillus cavernicola TaxID=176166 RepID=A0ABR4HJR6_9EURO
MATAEMQKRQPDGQWEEEILDAPPMSLSQVYTLEEQLKEDLPLTHRDPTTAQHLPKTTLSRQRASISAQSLDRDEYLPGKISCINKAGDDNAVTPQETVLYLAYGSNLASATFLGARGIKPLSQLNVIVPELRLTFDLPGVPYIEPCFAGTHFRNTGANKENTAADDFTTSENYPLLLQDQDQDRYIGPLVGVVYEVTLRDYAKIIATEGGGGGYKDIVVTSYPFPETYDRADPIPENPETQPIKAHTLLSPAGMQELRQHPTTSGLHPRPNAGHAQPSSRYLNLITTGAEEHNLPLAYREYLAQIQPYRITSMRQKIGKVIFLGMWAPILLLILALPRIFARSDGRSPRWVAQSANMAFAAMWSCYDHVFVHIFGDGERTVER